MDSKPCKSRREMLKSTCGFVGAAALLSIGGGLNAAALMGPGAMPRPKNLGVPQVGDLLVFAEGERQGKVITMADLVLDGPPVLVQPQDPSSGTAREEDNSKVLVLRLKPDAVPEELRDGSVQGVLAYSALCTHLGCVLNEWVADKKLFLCPCHEAAFDPMQGGKVVSGPGPRALPTLPLEIKDNVLVVAGEFSGWVGAKRG